METSPGLRLWPSKGLVLLIAGLSGDKNTGNTEPSCRLTLDEIHGG